MVAGPNGRLLATSPAWLFCPRLYFWENLNHLRFPAVLLLVALTGPAGRAQAWQPYFRPITEGTDYAGRTVYDVLVDRQGYLWSGGNAGLYRYDGYDFESFPAVITDSTALSHSLVTSLAETTDGELWIGTKVGLNRYDRRHRRFRRWFVGDGLPNNDVTAVAAAGTELLVATPAGLRRYLPPRDTFIRPAHLADSALLCVYADLGGFDLAGGTAHGLNLVTAAGERKYLPAPAAVKALATYRDELYVASRAGILRYDPGQDALLPVLPPEHPLHRVYCNDLLAVGNDLWITTRGQGVLRLDAGGAVEQFLPQGNLKNGLLDFHTRALASTGKNTLWISSVLGVNQFQLDPPLRWHLFPVPRFDGNQILRMELTGTGGVIAYLRPYGLWLSDRPGDPGRPAPFPENDYLNDRDVNDLYTDRGGTTWIPRGNDGLYGYVAATDTWLPGRGSARMRATRLNFVTEDATTDGLLWIGTSDGLLRYDPATGEERWLSPPGLWDNKVVAIYTDPAGPIWLSIGDYYHARLCRYDPATDDFEFVAFPAALPRPAREGRITKMRLAPDGTLWALSNHGMLRVDTGRMTLSLLEPHVDLGIATPRNFHVDGGGALWIGTDSYLHRYQPESGDLLTFPTHPAGNVRWRYTPVDTAGRVYFPTDNGILVLAPDSLPPPPPLPNLVLNEVFVNGEPHSLPAGRDHHYHLPLATGERDLRLTFAAPAYERAEAVRYAYRRPAESLEWQSLGRSRTLAFTNLPPGPTNVQLRSDDGQGRWNPQALELTVDVAPYWYEQTVIRIILAQLGLLALFLLGQFLLRRRLEREAHAQLVELDAFKSRFFTNITHEFRTPLTLILGPARRLAEAARRANDPTLGREARRIDRQGNRLLRMINQLLDLRKLEAGKLVVESAPTRLRAFCAELVEEFRPEARQQGIHLAFTTDFPAAAAEYLDRDKVQSILTNLVANALRFTPAGGRTGVGLHHDADSWWVDVTDTGPGIGAEDRERIFEPFIQAAGARPGGSGIGLALTREFCELLGGRLELHSAPGAGSRFTVRMPRRPAPEAPPVRVRPAGRPDTARASGKPVEQLPLVLVVEDDTDVAAYLRESLSAAFRVLVAGNGKEGLERARHELPDLVVSDVMMPGMTGLQLCVRLKSDPLTAHLPVLLLTARTADEHRLEGLERGADAYLTKPFSERELHLRLRNLLQLRDATARQLREQIVGNGAAAPPAATPAPPEQAAWLAQLREFILERLDDPDLSGEVLEREVGMSRSQLHRKLQATVGLSASRLVNQLRLEVARERLAEREESVAEIAYACGFRDPAYFSRKFRERYGKPPSAWRAEA